MPRSILEYAAVDKFAMLFITAKHTKGSKPDGVSSANKDSYDPTFLNAFKDDGLGIPDSITCQNYEHNFEEVDGVVNLHGLSKNKPSFKCQKMTMIWSNPDITDTPIKYHREDGPALIQFSDYCLMHNNGERRGFEVGQWLFRWFENGKAHREAGPIAANGDRLSASLDNEGVMRVDSESRSIFDWRYPNGGERIDATTVDQIIREHDLEVNEFAIGPNAFVNPMDQIAFYAHI